MIRREIHLPGQPPHWLLISQVEHARISGLMAEHGLAHLPEPIRGELLQAILHHDDGWASWETGPQLDENGRPLSFRELELEDSLSIWTASIQLAEGIGPLAALVVSGHFLRLLSASDSKSQPAARHWRRTWSNQRERWFTSWSASKPPGRARKVYREALSWLRLLDVLSLWICSVCPNEDEETREDPDRYRVSSGGSFATEFVFQQGQVRVAPWRFCVPRIAIQANGWLVPVRNYANVDELMAARLASIRQWVVCR
jgi:hypothetical protein